LYDASHAGKTPTHRFDYLFEPLDGEDIDEDNYEDEPIVTHGAHRRRVARPSKVLLGIIAVAVAAGTTATFMLVNRPDAVEPASSNTSDEAPVQTPPALFPPAVPAAVTPAQVPAAPPPLPPPAAPPVVEAPAVPPPRTRAVVEAPIVAPAVVPSPVPEATPPIEEVPAPATRLPISVEPEPRPAFPDQIPPEGGDRSRGGLLGGGGLL